MSVLEKVTKINFKYKASKFIFCPDSKYQVEDQFLIIKWGVISLVKMFGTVDKIA